MDQDKNRKLTFQRKSLACSILRGIGIGGLILLAATSPYFGLQVIKEIKYHYRKKKWRDFYKSVHYLGKRGLVQILGETNDGHLKIKLTKAGESIIMACDIDELRLDKSKPWDGKWRIVIFDVPVSKNKARLAFAERLRQVGFMMVQKSVWVCPHECDNEVSILRKFYNIEGFVTILKSDDIEDEYSWRRKFNLKDYKEAMKNEKSTVV